MPNNSNLILNTITSQIQALFGKEEAWSMAFWLMESVTGWGKAQLLSGREIPEEMVSELEQKTRRLLTHEPIQYVTGEAFFYGYNFRVLPRVLIPRPETEELVHWVLKEVQSPHKKRVLDVGTGSGCIAISLALENPGLSVTAIDVSPEALKVASSNAQSLGVQVKFVERNVLEEGLGGLGKFDVVVSNPPYVTPKEKQQMLPNVLEHEPETALFVPQNNPLLFYQSIAKQTRSILNPDGMIFFEINQYYAEQTAELVKKLGFSSVELRRDLNGNWRMLKAVWKP